MSTLIINDPIRIHTDPVVEPLPIPGLPIEREYADEAEDTPDIGYAGGANYQGAIGAPNTNGVRALGIPELDFKGDMKKAMKRTASVSERSGVKPLAIPEMQFTCD